MAMTGLVVMLTFAVSATSAATVVAVNGTASHAIPKTLYGQMFEDINHSGDGGLYAEMLQNRAFQMATPGTADALYSWAPVGAGEISVVADAAPVSSALPNSLAFTVPSDASGSVGFGNAGYFGIKVDPSWVYNASFYYKLPSALSSDLEATIALQTASGTVLVASNVTLSGSQTSWTQIFTTLSPSISADDAQNNFTVTVDGASAAGATVNFAMFSLMPPTYKGRENGMRVDIAEALAEMGPAFFRFPGGNNLEGESFAQRWKWNETIGPLIDRPGRLGDWSYVNTDGLGLMEYLYWCEDVGMEPIMAVYDGYSLDGQSVADANLDPYIQQAIEQIEFVIGDPATSEAAAKRASLGHEEPFTLNHVEIGNEDFVGKAPGTVQYRWRDFYGNLSAVFPQLNFIATSKPWNPLLAPTPKEYDVHVYQTPKWFANNSFYYDGFARNGTLYFEGEYAATSTNSSDIYGLPENGRLLWPTMQGAAGEAAFMTGLERNSDIVFAASYAPLLQNVESTQWTPDLVSFDATNVYLSTSYYVQKMFSLNKGDEYLPSTLPDQYGTLFWSVTRRISTSEVLFKVANSAATSVDLTFQLPFATLTGPATAEVLAGAANASNTPTTALAELVVPVVSNFIVSGSSFDYRAPAYSVSIVTVKMT